MGAHDSLYSSSSTVRSDPPPPPSWQVLPERGHEINFSSLERNDREAATMHGRFVATLCPGLWLPCIGSVCNYVARCACNYDHTDVCAVRDARVNGSRKFLVRGDSFQQSPQLAYLSLRACECREREASRKDPLFYSITASELHSTNMKQLSLSLSLSFEFLLTNIILDVQIYD